MVTIPMPPPQKWWLLHRLEILTVVCTTVVAVVCVSWIELSKAWFVGLNFTVLAIHAYFLGNAILTADRASFYPISSLVVLSASALLKYVRVES